MQFDESKNTNVVKYKMHAETHLSKVKFTHAEIFLVCASTVF